MLLVRVLGYDASDWLLSFDLLLTVSIKLKMKLLKSQ